MSHSKGMKLKLQIAAITFSQYRAFRLMKLTLPTWHKQYTSVTLRNVEPPATISLCCYQLGMLIVLFLYQLSILQNVRGLPTWHFEKQVMIIVWRVTWSCSRYCWWCGFIGSSCHSYMPLCRSYTDGGNIFQPYRRQVFGKFKVWCIRRVQKATIFGQSESVKRRRCSFKDRKALLQGKSYISFQKRWL